MCTKSQACRNRTAKEKQLLEYKRAKLPPKATVALCKRIMRFTDEDLDNMAEEEMDQPCKRGERCPQENFGNHSKVCKIKMIGLNHRKPGQSWHEAVLEQEEFNTNPKHYGGHKDQFANRYNYEDSAPFRRKEADSEGTEEE